LTIKDYILEHETKATKERLEKLVKIDAPRIMIEKTREALQKMESGIIEVNGDAMLLELEFETCAVKTGRGGKVYLQFDNFINYFPLAKYGRYITK
jgi:hypothetical protein